VTNREVNSLRVFEIKMLRRIFGGTTRVWRIRSKEEIERFFGSPNVVNELRGRRLQWLGHLARMEETRKFG
jgi:hypothetical protein